MEFEHSQSSNAPSEHMDHASGPVHPAAKAQSKSAHAAVAVAIPADAVRIVPVDGAVQLPAGTKLDAIHAVGRDLVVTLPDGKVWVIVDGALHVPQILIGPIHIPATNIAALIATSEPEPAAGAPQSSGGNFAEALGNIGNPFALGDLLPPTDFGLSQPEAKPFILGVVDHKPEVLIVTTDQPAGSTTATATVLESALPARGTEPAGSTPASTAETVTGTIQFTSLDQPNVITVNGTAITAVGQTVTTPLGLITITSIAPGVIGYSYTLLDNSTDPNGTEVITIAVRDGDGDVATATLTVAITDDVPTARADADAIAPNLYTAQTGNVITGSGTSSGVAGADTLGADGATVTGVHSATTSTFTAAGTVIAGQYGQLLIHADGSYSYVRSAGTPGGVADVFTYQLTDGDGDVSTATLTINIGDSPVGLEVPSAGDDGTQVDEAGLPGGSGASPGSRAGDESNATGGVILFEAHDGPPIITINGVRVTGEGQEIVLETGTFAILSIHPDSIEYGFVLTHNVSGDAVTQPINVTITDLDGDTVSSSFDIAIIDDVPTAVADTDRLAAGTYGPATGNVITDAEGDGGRDTPGADGAVVSLITGAGGSVSPGTAVAGQYGMLTLNADGNYSYVRNAGTPGGVSDVFTYTLRDGDGDTSRATLTIAIGDGSVTLRLPSGSDAGQRVSEVGLPSGSAPGGSATTSGSFAVSIADGPGHVVINGTTLTTVGQSIAGTFGILTIISISPTAIGYSYTLTNASSGDTNVDHFNVSVVDQDGDTATGTLRISITDDVPAAVNDTDSVLADATHGADGNVLTGVGGSDANTIDGRADTQGADHATVTSISFEGDSGFVGGTTPGAYGTLSIAADGSYLYTVDNSNLEVRGLNGSESLTETFTYTITDGDGDESSATLTITIQGQNDVVTITGLNAEGAEAAVSEANLPDGSAPNADALTRVGSFTCDAPDGVVSITIGGETLFDGDIVPGLTLSTDHGILTITGFDPVTDPTGEIIGGTIRYSYELTDNTALHTGSANASLTEAFAVSIIDTDGSVANASLDVIIIDDTPAARPDQGSVGEGQTLETTAATGLLANDTLGADEAVILGIRAQGSNPTAPANGGVGSDIVGLYGTLTLAEDGSYAYSSNPNAVPLAGASDVFVYTLRDADGDTSTTTLTIHLSDSGISATHLGVQVNEAALPTGSDPGSPDEIVSGDLNANASGGTGPLEFSLTGSGVGTRGTMTLNPDGTYLYTLTSPVHGVIADNGANTVPMVETFTYTATDIFGNTATNTIAIDVVDDVPTARVAPGIAIAEDAPTIAGNLLANDTPGADGASVTSVSVLGVNVAVSPSGTTIYTNALGTYTFQPGGAWSFDPISISNANPVNASFTYTITDGDGDQSTAQQQISVTDGANPRGGAPIALTLDDQNLLTGSTPSAMQPVSSTGQIQFVTGSDPIVTIGFGDTSGLGGGLTWTRDSATQITGRDGSTLVATLRLVVSGTTATVTATLDSNYAHHPDGTADDIAELGSVNVIALDSDGDRAISSVSLSVSDDVPTITAVAPGDGLLTVDESNLSVDATADLGSLFTVAMGADRPGTVTYAFEVSNASGLVDVATGSAIVLRSLGNVVEGRLAGSPTIVAFRLTIAPDGQATLDQLRAVQHADPSNPDDIATLPAQVIRLIATATDSDGDQASATINVGAALAFRDDGPAIHVADADTNNVLLTTHDSLTRGPASDVATANFASTLSIASSSFGADGPGSIAWSYALALGSSAAFTGLSSDGVPITLALVSGSVVGSAGGNQVFSVAVNANTGAITLTQFAEIDHGLPGSSSNYAAQLVELASNLILLRGTATIVDRDGDSASETVAVDLGGNIRFADDGPSVSSGGGGAPVLVVDETSFAVNATENFSGLFASTLDYGADGPGSVSYALGATAGPSGLIDSLTGEGVTLSLVGGVVYGRTATTALEVFRISLGVGGSVTFDQSRAIMHTPDTGPDQARSLTGTNLITLTATVTDGDGDTARSTADITGQFAIRDDAPLAVNDEDNVARDGEVIADGNVLTGVGGTDKNGTDGIADIAGADGGVRVSALAFGATTGTLGTALAGDYGFLTLAADGSYRYQLDQTDPAVAALNAHQTLIDTFQYTVRDADGDTSTATIRITITGANEFPIARADTNWVLDGPSGSDPTATGNVLQDIVHPGAPSGSFADVGDNDPNLEPISVTTAGTYAGLYGTLVIGANGAYTYTLNADNAAVNALDTGQTLVETFSYTISDGLLSVGSTLSVTVFGTNDAPTIGTTIARVSEEGLPGGLPDAAPNATLDTTNSTTFSGNLAIADLDAGETLTATLGSPGAVLTAGGVPVTWSGVGTGTLIGSVGSSEVIRVTLAPSGAYTVTLSHAVDHSNVTLEDLKEFNVPVSVSDGTVTTTSGSAIQIVIEDDAPVAVGETGSSTQPQQDVNTLFILDFSDSIDSGELNVMLSAVKDSLTQLDSAASGTLGIRFVIFSSGSFASPAFTNAADANLYLDSLNPEAGGVRPSQALPPDGIGLNTNYTGAIQTALANFSVVPGASNQVFFLSDGNPNQQVQFGPPPTFGVINSLTNATATAWNNFVDTNHVNVTAIGIDNNPLQPINIQRLADVDLNDAPNNHPILVTDFHDLVATLLAVIVPSAVSGDLDANDSYGADGGHLHSIMIGAVTYTWDGATHIAVSTGGTISGTSLSAVTTPMGGTLTLDFATGQYNYQPPSPITVTATEVFSYTLIDRDGDTASASLSVTITAAAPPIAVDLDGDGVEFVSSTAGVHFDYGGDGVAESTAWVAPDDGLLVIDKNGDGLINNGSELVFARAGLSDLQGLAATYDSNHDGRLDASDAAFSQFGIWHDVNSNGVTDAGELDTLAQAGISSIALISDGRGYVAADGQVVVRGESIFTRADGSTGRIADASFATNFLSDPQRTMATATNGMSAALLAAGLVSAMPLAAQTPDSSASENPVVVQADFGAQANASNEIQATDATTSRVDFLTHAPEHLPGDDQLGHQHFGGNDRATDSPIHTLAGQPPAPAFAELLDRAEIEPIDAGARQGPFAPSTDQAPILLVPQQPLADAGADQIKAIVTDAMEGRAVDLDALLGSAAPALPQIQLQEGSESGFLAESGSFSMGNLFMPDMADQHVLAQLEHAAATGHA